MIILHYFLGFPPYRTGGLTKYAFDLMQSQVGDGNRVIALWPGQIKKMGGAPTIKKSKMVAGIESYELLNPLPVPLDEGIKDFYAYTQPCDARVYSDFLSEEVPEVIHIHTLMGLHKEFLVAAKELEIRTVYTSHDYFGLCPKVTLYRFGQCCDDDKNCENCIQCNTGALSLEKIQLMQSPIYRILKNTVVVKALRKKHRNVFFHNETVPDMPRIDVKAVANEYCRLRSYYIGMFNNIEFIHFNSSVSEKIFCRYFMPNDSRVIPITHRELDQIRRLPKKKSDKTRILCLAPAKPFKGFNILKAALDELWEEGKRNFELTIYGATPCRSPYMLVKEDGYRYSDLPEIFADTDFMVAPSVWYETFGFTVLEAVSYGVPVIVSDHVGAKDIIGDCGTVVKSGSVEELKKAIINLSNELNNSDCEKSQGEKIRITWRDFIDENYSIYKGREKKW